MTVGAPDFMTVPEVSLALWGFLGTHLAYRFGRFSFQAGDIE